MTCLARHRGVQEEIELEPILKLSARRRRVVSTTPRPLYPRPRQTPSTHCTRDRVNLGADLDVSRKVRPHENSIPGPSSL
jgi:hypothetical protein